MAVFSGNGSATAPSFTFSSDTNLGIFRGGTDQLSFTTAGTERITFNADGTSDFFNQLTVSSGTFDTTSAAGVGVRLNRGGSTLSQRPTSVGVNEPLFRGYYGTSENFQVQASGNVLIGSDISTSPEIELNADGSADYAGEVIAGAFQTTNYDITDASGQGSRAGAGGTFTAQLPSSASTKGAYLVRGYYGTNNTYLLTADGTQYIGGVPNTSPAIELTAGGDGSFVGNLSCGEFDSSSNTTSGVRSLANGLFSVQRPTSGAATNRSFRSFRGTTETCAIQNNGTIVIGGDLTSISGPTPNILLNEDGDAVFAGDVQMASLNGGPIAGTRNFVLNGEMNIWQRRPGAGVSNPVPFATGEAGKWFADRWHVPNNADYTNAFWSQGDFDNPIASLTSYAYISKGTSSLSSAQVMTAIANPDFPVGEVLVFSLWVPDGLPVSNLQINNRSGSFGTTTTAASVGTGTIIETSSNTGSATGVWKRYAYDVVITSRPSSQNVLEVRFNVPFDTSDGAKFTGCRLELGTIPTPNEYITASSEASTLTACQRYYQSSVNRGWQSLSTANYSPEGMISFVVTNAGDVYSQPFKGLMRSQPTVLFRDVNRNDAKCRRTSGSILRLDMIPDGSGAEGFSFTTSNPGTSGLGRTFAYVYEAEAEL